MVFMVIHITFTWLYASITAIVYFLQAFSHQRSSQLLGQQALAPILLIFC